MAYFHPPIVGVTLNPSLTFKERVYGYDQWIKLYPLTHIHVKLNGQEKGFLITSERSSWHND